MKYGTSLMAQKVKNPPAVIGDTGEVGKDVPQIQKSVTIQYISFNFMANDSYFY